MKGEIELHNISFLILKVELHFKCTYQSTSVTLSDRWFWFGVAGHSSSRRRDIWCGTRSRRPS